MKINLHSLNRQARAARKGQDFLHGCTGKTKYKTWEEAAHAATFLRYNTGVRRTDIYQCKHCELFHIATHKP